MNVLLAEDSKMYRQIISRDLTSWGFAVVTANDGKAAWDLLQEADAPSLVLLDWVLPEIEGVELCRRIRQADANSRYTYTILLTSRDDKGHMMEAMQAGVDDYVEKPFDPDELRARVLVGKRILDLQQQLMEARDSLHMAATYDSLTRLLNRGEILGFLKRELARAKREKTPVGLVLLDLDHFKQVNDIFGHLSGDAVLSDVGKRIRSDLRAYDGAGRYGGEEFLLVLPGCDLANTLRRADQIRRKISESAVAAPGGTLTITASMGITVAEIDQADVIEELLGQADSALYRAKENGRDRVEIHCSKNLMVSS